MKAVLFVCALLVGATVQAGIPLTTLEELNSQGTPTLAPMLERVTPAVVNISTRSRVRVQSPLNSFLSDPFFQRFFNVPMGPRERETQSLGSGVIVDAGKGYIITNNHVVGKADEITVTLRDGRQLKANLIGSDPETDIAIVQVAPEKLSEVPVADSTQLRVGDFVVAIGNPFGLGQTVTSGIVSALGRRGLGIEGYEDFIQTDASINPGNSGGALVNLRGELVGINTAILAPGGGGNVGIGFAIPINLAKDVMSQIVEFGKVRRGRLGVSTQDMTPSLADAFGMEQLDGAVVSKVSPGSAADNAGLKAGDVIISVNDRAVKNSADLHNLIGLLRAGQHVSLEVIRNGKKKRVVATVVPIEEVSVKGADVSPVFGGATFIFLNSDTMSEDDGVRVEKVKPQSNAWRAGLREGDIILSVNRYKVADVDQMKEAIRRGRRGVLLNVLRGDEALFLLIK